MPNLPEETHGLATFLFPRYHRLRIPMKNPSRSFYFVAILSTLLALAGIFMAGYYSGRNDFFAKLVPHDAVISFFAHAGAAAPVSW